MCIGQLCAGLTCGVEGGRPAVDAVAQPAVGHDGGAVGGGGAQAGHREQGGVGWLHVPVQLIPLPALRQTQPVHLSHRPPRLQMHRARCTLSHSHQLIAEPGQ